MKVVTSTLLFPSLFTTFTIAFQNNRVSLWIYKIREEQIIVANAPTKLIQSSSTAMPMSDLYRDTSRDIGVFGYEQDQRPMVLDDFDHILESLEIFKSLYDEIRVPITFEVPIESPWPSYLHGLRLGKRLEKLLSSSEFFQFYPDKVEALRRIGFKPAMSSLIDDWDILYECLQVYRQVFGDLRISVKFIVPEEKPW